MTNMRAFLCQDAVELDVLETRDSLRLSPMRCIHFVEDVPVVFISGFFFPFFHGCTCAFYFSYFDVILLSMDAMPQAFEIRSTKTDLVLIARNRLLVCSLHARCPIPVLASPRYLSQQIVPPVSRLCEPIEGTSMAVLAERMGLDASKFASHVRAPRLACRRKGLGNRS